LNAPQTTAEGMTRDYWWGWWIFVVYSWVLVLTL